MPLSAREPGLPRPLTYSAALTVGIMAALALQIWLGRAGYDLATIWQDSVFARAMELRAAGPWWAMAVAAFIAAGATAAALSRLPPPWSRFRLLRWLLGAAIVAALADVGHSAAGLPADTGAAASAGVRTAVSLAALLLAAPLALCGAYFTVRR
jgi:hypothetical protein